MDYVKKIINSWDPIGLLFYAPNDEYHSEVEEVSRLLYMTDDSLELAQGIFDIFLRSFGEDNFNRSITECQIIAQTLLDSK